jgi:predicted RNase H-like HicB family nuclease
VVMVAGHRWGWQVGPGGGCDTARTAQDISLNLSKLAFIMFAEYIMAALERAEYKIIDDPEPIFGEVPELEGVWASGKTVEECRRELISVIEGWIALRLKMGDMIPPINNVGINVSTEPIAVV